MKSHRYEIPEKQQKVAELTQLLNEATKERDLELYRKSEEGMSYTQLSFEYRMTAARVGQIVTKVANQLSKPRKGGNHGKLRKGTDSQD